MQQFKFLEVVHSLDGDIDPIVIDDVKYEANPDKPEEALLGDDGEKVLFKETEVIPPKEDETDVSKMSIEDLAKTNPALAKVLEDGETAKKDLATKEQAEKDKKEKKEEDDGEWKKLANERKDKIDILEKGNTKKDELIVKYKGSLGKVLENAISQIPEENRGLVPAEFSDRQKLDYISTNAKTLGIKSIVNLGDKKIPDNDETKLGTEEQQLVKELSDLQEKENKTPAELDDMFEKSKALKTLRAEK